MAINIENLEASLRSSFRIKAITDPNVQKILEANARQDIIGEAFFKNQEAQLNALIALNAVKQMLPSQTDEDKAYIEETERMIGVTAREKIKTVLKAMMPYESGESR